MSIFAIPESWNAAFLTDTPIVRTKVFWATIPWILVDALLVANLSYRMGRAAAVHPIYAYAIPALVLLLALLVYQGWKFIEFIRVTRVALRSIASGPVLAAARFATRMFILSAGGFAAALWIVLIAVQWI
jgi:hypothetical protein